jgi:hypothetical protein
VLLLNACQRALGARSTLSMSNRSKGIQQS